MAPDVAETLARLGQRGHTTGDDDLLFPGDAGGYLDASALRRRYDRALTRAGLRPLRFHDLRHTFGTRMLARADIRRVQAWMGHADVQTTMRYLHYAPRHDDAVLVAGAFRRAQPEAPRADGTAHGLTASGVAVALRGRWAVPGGEPARWWSKPPPYSDVSQRRAALAAQLSASRRGSPNGHR